MTKSILKRPAAFLLALLLLFSLCPAQSAYAAGGNLYVLGGGGGGGGEGGVYLAAGSGGGGGGAGAYVGATDPSGKGGNGARSYVVQFDTALGGAGGVQGTAGENGGSAPPGGVGPGGDGGAGGTGSAIAGATAGNGDAGGDGMTSVGPYIHGGNGGAGGNAAYTAGALTHDDVLVVGGGGGYCGSHKEREKPGNGGAGGAATLTVDDLEAGSVTVSAGARGEIVWMGSDHYISTPGAGGGASLQISGTLDTSSLTITKPVNGGGVNVDIDTLEASGNITITVTGTDADEVVINTVNVEAGESLTINNTNGKLTIDTVNVENGGRYVAKNPANLTVTNLNVPPSPPSDATDSDPEPTYSNSTFTDPTGVTVSGQMTSYAKLTVRERVLHAEGACPACDDIRARIAAGELIVLYDISISGGYTGELEVSIPVGQQYNGQTVTILHCVNGKLESITCTVQNGVAKGTFKKLSPFAVVRANVSVPENTIVDPPKTGAGNYGMVGIALVLGALVLGVVVRRRKHLQP